MTPEKHSVEKLQGEIEALQNWIEFHILSKECDCDADSDGVYKCLKCSYEEEFNK